MLNSVDSEDIVIDMAKKAVKEIVIGIRISKDLKDALTKRAEKEGLTLTTYVRRLLMTHPELEGEKK
jgi:predicted DNA binding CopG/RHH family protein